MHTAQASRTALRVAMRRAAHQLRDTPRVLDDPLALRIVGEPRAREIAAVDDDPVSRATRAFMAVRSRLAEDTLAAAVAAGVRQYVVLGAGLDTFAYRNPHAASGLRVFEVDHPATQAWKQTCLADAGIPIPRSVTFAPLDFERETLAGGLEAAGFDRAAPACFAWLGVAMYLTEEAIAHTLAYVGALAPPSRIVFDYALPRAVLTAREQIALDALSARVAAAGEPFTTFFDPAGAAARLQAAGLEVEDDLGRDEINARYFAGREDGLALRAQLGRIVIGIRR
jgi:methyltransferase (TIGR00027 family)